MRPSEGNKLANMMTKTTPIKNQCFRKNVLDSVLSARRRPLPVLFLRGLPYRRQSRAQEFRSASFLSHRPQLSWKHAFAIWYVELSRRLFTIRLTNDRSLIILHHHRTLIINNNNKIKKKKKINIIKLLLLLLLTIIIIYIYNVMLELYNNYYIIIMLLLVCSSHSLLLLLHFFFFFFLIFKAVSFRCRCSSIIQLSPVISFKIIFLKTMIVSGLSPSTFRAFYVMSLY